MAKFIVLALLIFVYFFFPTFYQMKAHFCIPGFTDSGPGSIGCWYSSSE